MAKHLLETGIRRLGTPQSGFYYRCADSTKKITDSKMLQRIVDLKIPPAWTDVRIAPSARAKVQAIGRDSAGRWQYLYHAAYRARKDEEKFARLLKFAEALPQMRRITSQHLKQRQLTREKVLAAMTRLMNAAFFRVGGESYAERNGVYGIATLRRKHISIEGDTIVFEYRGKWGVRQRRAVTDAALRKIIKCCIELPGQEVFKYHDEQGVLRDVKSRDLNDYIKTVVGPGFTSKDFRTWAGTLVAAMKLAELGAADNEKLAQKNIVIAVDDVAERLGNTRAIARSSYISPRLLEHYLEGSTVAVCSKQMLEIIAARQRGLAKHEQAVLSLLKKRLRREAGRRSRC